ncbi:MAG: MotA/TolQ/ExbB proton channel family protein [Planctomycetes bacterium]|nr:MotA/TolQ/ExbB proton channel family protein [Planctomycetota bacterium]
MEAQSTGSALTHLIGPTLFEQGGPVMYVLMAVAIIGLTFIIYCLLTLRRRAVMSPALVEVAETVQDEEDFPAAVEVCKREGGPFAEILASVIATRDLARPEAEAIIEGAGRRAMHDLSRGTLALEVVSGISTMLGLLGTVSGMFGMMMSIQEAGIKDIAAISGGIGEALITTIGGLIIAIPAYVAFVYFSRRVEDVVLMMEEYAIHLMARIRRDDAVTVELPAGAAASGGVASRSERFGKPAAVVPASERIVSPQPGGKEPPPAQPLRPAPAVSAGSVTAPNQIEKPLPRDPIQGQDRG